MSDTEMAPVLSRRVLAAGMSYTAFGLFAPVPALLAVVLRVLPIGVVRRQNLTRGMIRGLCWLFVELMQLFGLYSYQVRREFSGVPVGKLIVANHPMLLDAVFVMAYISNVCCIAKPALARNPFTGPTLRQAGFVLSDDPDLLSTMVSKLHRGENVLLFPEGTRNTSDLELNFRRGAANLAVISGCDVLPVVLECQPRALQRGQKWYQVPAQRAKIRMTICNPLVVNDCVDRALPRTLQYRQFTHILVALYRDRLSKLSVDSKADHQSDSSAVCSLKENVCNES